MNPIGKNPTPRRLNTDVMFASSGIPLRVMRVPTHGSHSTQHSHAFQELVVILDGHGKHEIGTEVYDIEAGDVFVILGDTTHGYPETENLSLINILFDSDRLRIPRGDIGNLPGYHALFTIEPQLRAITKDRNHLRLSTDDLGYTVEIVAEIEEELQQKTPGFQYMAVSHLMRLTGFLSRRFTKVQLDRTRPIAQISRLLSHMNQHYEDPLSVEDLIEVTHMSQSSLMRTFHQVTGRSPVDYLIRLRVSKTEAPLRMSGSSITDISHNVGFSDSNYFTRQFKRVHGVSPREYRNRYRV